MYNVSKIYTLYFVNENIFAWMKVLYMLCSITSIPVKRETGDAKRGVIRRNTIATIIRVKQIYNDLKKYYAESKIVSNTNPTDNCQWTLVPRNCKQFLSHYPHASCYLGNHVWQSEEGQAKQCPKKEIKRQTMIYKTTAQKTRNLTIRITTRSELI